MTTITGLIAHLDCLRDSDQTVAQLMAAGPEAIGLLREYLLDGRPSGTYQPRQCAVEALSGLGAKDALMEYLGRRKQIGDPVARFGEEAVESTAARELAAWRTDDVFDFLLGLARDRKLPGVIDALGEFGRPEAIPYLDQALEDDLSRPVAEDAFRKFGARARVALVLSASTPLPNAFAETPSSLRRRRSALGLLSEAGIAPENWTPLRALLDESDADLVIRAARLGLAAADRNDRAKIARRLLQVLPAADWHLQEDAEECLQNLLDDHGPLIENEIRRRMSQPVRRSVQDRARRTLLRVWKRSGRI